MITLGQTSTVIPTGVIPSRLMIVTTGRRRVGRRSVLVWRSNTPDGRCRRRARPALDNQRTSVVVGQQADCAAHAGPAQLEGVTIHILDRLWVYVLLDAEKSAETFEDIVDIAWGDGRVLISMSVLGELVPVEGDVVS